MSVDTTRVTFISTAPDGLDGVETIDIEASGWAYLAMNGWKLDRSRVLNIEELSA